METSYDSARLLAHVGWVRALARSLVRGAADADDLAQEALTVALERGPRGAVAWRGWFRVVLQNLVAERARSGDRRAARERFAARDETVPSELDSAARLSTHARVVAAVEALDEPFRTAVLLRYFDELPPRKIAARLDVPVRTVNSRLERAHARLRERLQAEHGGDRRGAWLALARLAGPERSVATPWKSFGLVAAVLVVIASLAWFVARPTARATDALVAVSGPSNAPAVPIASEAVDASTGRSAVVRGPREADLEGRVLDPDGRPIAGATIEVRARAAAGLFFASGEFAAEDELVARATSDAAGCWRVLAPRERSLDVFVRAEGFARTRHADVFAGGVCESVLERPATLALVARDARGRALADASVRLTARDAWQPLVDERTDSLGRWSSDELPPGAWSLELLAEAGFAPLTEDITLAAGARVERTFVVPDGLCLTGRVVDAADGTPLARARLFVDQHHTALARSDARGEFKIANLPAATSWDVYADAEGFAPSRRVVVATDAARGSAPDPIEFALARGWILRGRLVDVDDAPIANAWVAAYADAPGTAFGEQSSVKSDADGRFELAGLHADLGCALFVAAPGRGREAWRLPLANEGETLDAGSVRLGVGTSIAGRLLDGAGRPLQGARVELSRAAELPELALAGHETAESDDDDTTVVWIGTGRPTGPAGDVESERSIDASALGYVRVEVQRDGSFRVVDLAPGRWTVRSVPSSGGARVARDVELTPGGRVEGLELRLPSGGVIGGRVVDPDGRPLVRAMVLLYRANASLESRAARTDDAGAFRFDGLEDREYRVFADFSAVDAKGGRQRPFASRSIEPLRIDGPVLEIGLGRTAPLRGRIVDASGAPLAGALVTGLDDAGRQPQTLCDPEGRFGFAVAESATLELSASWPGPAARNPQTKVLRGKLADVKASVDELVVVLE